MNDSFRVDTGRARKRLAFQTQLQRLLLQGLARELAYTGDRLGAERALDILMAP